METQKLKKKMELRAEIIKIKGPQIAKIEGVKIENMTEEDLRPIDLDTLNELLKNIQDTLKEQQENKFKKAFTKSDYIERETRKHETEKIKKIFEKEKDQNFVQHEQNALQAFEVSLVQKKTLETAREFKESFFKTILEQRKMEYETKINEFRNQIEKEFKNNILKSAQEAYNADKIKKEEEEKQLREEKQKQLQEQINNQQADQNKASASEWRIVQEEKEAPPTFDEILRIEKPKEDQWRTGEILRNTLFETKDAPMTRAFTGGTSTIREDKGVLSKNYNSITSTNKEEDNTWRTNTVKAATKPVEVTGPTKFTNTKKTENIQNSNTISQGNPNEGIMRRQGGPTLQTNFKPTFSKSYNQGNPNSSTQTGVMTRNTNTNPNPNNKSQNPEKKDNTGTNSEKWRK